MQKTDLALFQYNVATYKIDGAIIWIELVSTVQ